MGWGNKFPDMKNDPSYLEGRLSNAETQLAQKANQNDFDIEKTRIDNLVANAGNTDGNAELLDIRVGSDGKTYPNSGEAVRSQISSLKDELANLSEGVSYVHTEDEDIIVQTNYHSGYWWSDTENASASYFYTDKFVVKEGDIVTVLMEGIIQPIRFVEAYNGNTVDSANSKSAESMSYTVPSGVDSLIITCYSVNQNLKVVHIARKSIKYDVKIDRKQFCFTATSDTLASNTDLVVAKRIDNKKNCSYLFTGFFSTFDSLKIGHGKTEYGSVYMIIDNTNITTYSATGSQFQTFAHGLTLKDFISVNIKVDESVNARASVTIRTNGNDSVITDVIFFGCNGDIYASSTSLMTNVKFQYIVSDMKKDIFIFGDSYTGLADNARWPYYLLISGYTNMLINGFGGATSADALVAFNNILKVQKPKYLVWLLGMNDADTTEINPSWKNTVDTVIAYCENYNIIPILATIPNTPTIINTFKNDYIRNSGYRYVDFAKAVNGEGQGSSWYEGMLSSDNVHPTDKGAKALASRILIDIPELVA